jgi:hypothetical protein
VSRYIVRLLEKFPVRVLLGREVGERDGVARDGINRFDSEFVPAGEVKIRIVSKTPGERERSTKSRKERRERERREKGKGKKEFRRTCPLADQAH